MKNLLFIVLALFLSCQLPDPGRRAYNMSEQDQPYGPDVEMGKSIGRNAMLIYLSRSKQVDSIKIELADLLKIEDSLSIEYKKSNNR